ncbi:MAG: hypothetical protein ACOY90_04255 [Candidatus Zhuqueibacterota bacterium]
MKMRQLSFIFIVVALFWGCQKSQQVSLITGWEKYKDPYFKVQFAQPVNWFVNAEGSRIRLYSSPQSVDKFMTPTAKGVEGVQFIISFQQMEQLKTLDEYSAEYQSELSASGLMLKTEKKSVDNIDAALFEYTEVYGKNAKVTTIETVAIKDTVLYIIGYKAFNELATMYRPALDTLLASIKLPQSKEKPLDPSLPSAEFTSFSNNFLKISHPDNFSSAVIPLKGETKFSLELKGYRQDSNIRIDILPAKGLTVEKVVEQNIAKFPRAVGPNETTISGQKALSLNYSPAKEISSRVYFTVKNDQVYRIIMNYYQPMKESFLPAFEKTVSSLQIL